jgi:hypothetical protein
VSNNPGFSGEMTILEVRGDYSALFGLIPVPDELVRPRGVVCFALRCPPVYRVDPRSPEAQRFYRVDLVIARMRTRYREWLTIDARGIALATLRHLPSFVEFTDGE